MARTTTYETQIRIGAKYTGGPEVAKANRDIDRTERNVKGLGAAMQRARRHFFDFGKVAAGAFAGFTAAGILGAAVRGVKDLGVAAFKAADEVVKLREGNKRLLMTYGMTSKQAAETEKRLYGVATAMEKGVGHDAEIMSKVLVGMRKSLSTEEIEKNQAAISGYFTAISEGEPTIEKGAQAFEELNNLFMRGKGPALNLMKWDKERIKIFQKLSTDQRKYYGLIRLNQLYGHQTAEFFKTDTGKMNYAMTLFGNLLENVGEESVNQKGKIADLLISIAAQLDPISRDLGKIIGLNLKEWLSGVNTNMPEYLTNFKIWADRAKDVFWWLEKIQGLFDKINEAKWWPFLKLMELIRNAPKLPWEPGQIITPQIPGAMDWRYGGSTGAPTTTEEANKQHEAARKEAEKIQRRSDYAPYERESRAMQEIKRAESVSSGPTPGGVLGGALTGKEKAFEEAGRRHGVDPDLLMAIAEFETGHGSSKMVRERRNPAGVTTPGQPNLYRTFATIEEGIEEQAKIVARLQKRVGSKEISALAREYAPVGAANDPNRTNAEWPGAVRDQLVRVQKAREKARATPPSKISLSEDVIPLLQEGAGAYPLGEKLSKATRDINAGGRIGGGGGGTSVAMNSPITINGVPAGREGAVGREVTRALQDPDRLVLAQLRSAKGSEQRLTYDV